MFNPHTEYFENKQLIILFSQNKWLKNAKGIKVWVS